VFMQSSSAGARYTRTGGLDASVMYAS